MHCQLFTSQYLLVWLLTATAVTAKIRFSSLAANSWSQFTPRGAAPFTTLETPGLGNDAKGATDPSLVLAGNLHGHLEPEKQGEAEKGRMEYLVGWAGKQQRNWEEEEEEFLNFVESLREEETGAGANYARDLPEDRTNSLSSREHTESRSIFRKEDRAQPPPVFRSYAAYERVIRSRSASRREAAGNVHIFGSDDRIRIAGKHRRMVPYSNIVRLSIGCTGTLITPRHVLTASHCIHNGRAYTAKIDEIKVEVPSHFLGGTVAYVSSYEVPQGWLDSTNTSLAWGIIFDYAILTLRVPVSRRTRFVPFAIPSTYSHLPLYFAGFPEDKPGQLWQSNCPVRDGLTAMNDNLLLTRCDSAEGNSGAAIFVDLPGGKGRRIVGVLSSLLAVKMGGRETEYNAVTAITLRKYFQICKAIQPEGFDNGICPKKKVAGR